MVEQLAAAAAAAIVSAGSAAAMAAAKRASETRDAVLIVRGQLTAMDQRLSTNIVDQRTMFDRVERHLDTLESRVSALEAGHVDRRKHNYP